MIEIVVATKNNKKLNEIKTLLKDLDIKVLSSQDFQDLPEVKEDADSFDKNAIKKATTIAKLTSKLTIADDSGLEVDILGGKPGVLSARFAGNGVRYEDNNLKLLKLLEGIPLYKRKARFVCSIAIADKSGSIIDIVKGSCSGLIGFEPRGTYGFGYDPLFLIPKYGKTFAELGAVIKNGMSHRSKALKKAKKVILKYIRKSLEVEG